MHYDRKVETTHEPPPNPACTTQALPQLGLGLTAAFVPALAMASTDAWPTKPIRFIVPYAPGGLPDTVARVLSQQLTHAWASRSR